MRTLSILWIVSGLAATPGLGAVQQTDNQESLGDLARQIRQERQKAPKPANVFTNDDIQALPRPAAAPSEPAPEKPAEGEKPQDSAANPPSAEGAQGKSPVESGPPEASGKDRAYWQGKFKEARMALAKVKEAQQLAEDELNLLQIQQARELNSIAKDELGAKIQDKQSEVDTKKSATEEAQKALDALEKALKESGAPEEWSVTESAPSPDSANSP